MDHLPKKPPQHLEPPRWNQPGFFSYRQSHMGERALINAGEFTETTSFGGSKGRILGPSGSGEPWG